MANHKVLTDSKVLARVNASRMFSDPKVSLRVDGQQDVGRC